MIRHFLKFMFVREFKKKDLGGFQMIGVYFLPFLQKGFLCVISPIFKIQYKIQYIG